MASVHGKQAMTQEKTEWARHKDQKFNVELHAADSVLRKHVVRLYELMLVKWIRI